MSKTLNNYIKSRMTLLKLRIFLYSLFRYVLCCFNFKKRRKKMIYKNKKTKTFKDKIDYIETCYGDIPSEDCTLLINDLKND